MGDKIPPNARLSKPCRRLINIVTHISKDPYQGKGKGKEVKERPKPRPRRTPPTSFDSDEDADDTNTIATKLVDTSQAPVSEDGVSSRKRKVETFSDNNNALSIKRSRLSDESIKKRGMQQFVSFWSANIK